MLRAAKVKIALEQPAMIVSLHVLIKVTRTYDAI